MRVRTIYGEREIFTEYIEVTKENLSEYFIDNFGSNVADLKTYFSPYALNYHIFRLNKNLGAAAKEQSEYDVHNLAG